jgi:type IX secretion system PorP/SprF family membrane protein
MKTLFTFICILLASSTFAQQDMFWNHYSNINPAMSGLQYQQHGAFSYSGNRLKYQPKNLAANYNMRLGENHGVGLAYSGQYSNVNSSNIIANYNYQFNLKKAGRLSAGIGAGVNLLSATSIYTNLYNHPSPITHLQLNAGITYKWKGLLTGISFQNIDQPRQQVHTGFFSTSKPVYTVHAEYEVPLSKRFQLTPRAIYTHTNGRNRINTDLTLSLDKKFSLGAMFNLNGVLGVHAGWDIMEKYRIAYLYSSGITNTLTNYSNIARHQITIGINLR